MIAIVSAYQWNWPSIMKRVPNQRVWLGICGMIKGKLWTLQTSRRAFLSFHDFGKTRAFFWKLSSDFCMPVVAVIASLMTSCTSWLKQLWKPSIVPSLFSNSSARRMLEPWSVTPHIVNSFFDDQDSDWSFKTTCSAAFFIIKNVLWEIHYHARRLLVTDWIRQENDERIERQSKWGHG